MAPDCWNHNSAYHPWVVRATGPHARDVLDVGWGEGLSFDDFDPRGRIFDVVTFVASIHHMDLRAALRKSGSLLVVGV